MTSPTFRDVFGRVPTSVVVIAAMLEGTPVGVSVGSFSSVSLDPPLAGFYIARSSSTWPKVAATGGFAVSVLSDAQEEVSRRFATSGIDKFDGVPYGLTPSGNPVLAGSAAWMDCRIWKVDDAGDHLLVLGEVVAFDRSPVGPLVFLGGSYGRFESHASPIPGSTNHWGAKEAGGS